MKTTRPDGLCSAQALEPRGTGGLVGTPKRPIKESKPKTSGEGSQKSYGTMAARSATASGAGTKEGPAAKSTAEPTISQTEPIPGPEGAVMTSHGEPDSGFSGAARSQRPPLSRQGSAIKFSSSVVPETKVTTEGGVPVRKIMFADSETPVSSRPERPAFSRNSSFGRFSSRVVPETKVSDQGGAPLLSRLPLPRLSLVPGRRPGPGRTQRASGKRGRCPSRHPRVAIVLPFWAEGRQREWVKLLNSGAASVV